MKLSTTRFAAFLAAFALGAAACGSSDGAEDVSSAPAAATEDSGSGDTSSSVLDISAPAADGTTLNLSDYAGQDLMLWFWAPW